MKTAEELKEMLDAQAVPVESKAKQPKSLFIRQLNRAIFMATNPWFESDKRRSERVMFERAWDEANHEMLTPSERLCIRGNIGQHWATTFPDRVLPIVNPGRGSPWLLRNPEDVPI